MPSAIASRRPDSVRKGRRYTSAEVHAECVAAVEDAGLSQAEVAALTEKSPGTISRAMTDASGRYANTQALILNKLKGWTVERFDPPSYWRREA